MNPMATHTRFDGATVRRCDGDHETVQRGDEGAIRAMTRDVRQRCVLVSIVCSTYHDHLGETGPLLYSRGISEAKCAVNEKLRSTPPQYFAVDDPSSSFQNIHSLC